MSTDFAGITFAHQNATPSDDAIIRRAMLDDGILSGCELSYIGSTLTMAAGQLMICGRQIRHPSVQNWPVVDATTGFARVLLTIDLTKTATKDTFEQVSATLEYANTIAGFPDLLKTDINVTGTIYQTVLCVVSLSPGGISSIVYSLPKSEYGVGSGKSTIIVNAPTGSTVYIVNQDGRRKDAPEKSGTWTFRGCGIGTWIVHASLGSDQETADVVIRQDNQLMRYKVNINYVKIYGISRDVTLASPDWVRTDDAVGLTATASVGTQAGRSDFDSRYPWSGIARETLATGDVMVKIPKFWYRRYLDGNVEHIKIGDKFFQGSKLHPAFNHAGIESSCVYVGAYLTSDANRSLTSAYPALYATRDNLRTSAKAKGAGWGLIDISTLSAIQMLILVEFATYNLQDTIGMGNVSSGYVFNTGTCDSVPNLTGMPAGTDGYVDAIWRGIECLWGGAWEFCDGINLYDGRYCICNDPSQYVDNTDTGYEYTSFFGKLDWLGSFITREGIDALGSEHVMLPSVADGGSDTTYICDAIWAYQYGWTVLAYGGSFQDATLSGLFAISCGITSAHADGYYTSRLLFVPAEGGIQ